MFSENGSSWSTVATKTGTFANNYGNQVAMNSDGTVVITGSPGFSSNSGKVYIYSGNSFGTENTISGSSNLRFGEQVCINGDGTVIGIGSAGITTLNSRSNITNFVKSRVSIYKKNGSNWEKKGVIYLDWILKKLLIIE